MDALTAICLPAPEAAVAIVAEWDAGGAVLPLDPRTPAPERERILAVTRPTRLLDADGVRDLPDGHPVDPDVVAVVATSGTTGEPKGVELTGAGRAAMVDASTRALDAGAAAASGSAGPGDGWLCCLPLTSVAGLGVVARAWSTGVPLDVVPRFEPAALGRTPAALVSLVPTTLLRALDAGVDLSRFHRILVGGAPLPPALRQRAEAAGAHVVSGYGLTETWGGVLHDGRPLAGVEVRLGAGDEILVRSATVMRGYRLRPDLTAEVLSPDGWLRTGDAGAWCDDGTLAVVDRLRDLVVSGGVNVSPTEVEAVLAQHPGVADVVVGGAPDPEWGEVVVAHVIAADRRNPPALETLRSFAAERLAAAKLPRRLVLVSHVPRTPGGKPVRRLLSTHVPSASEPRRHGRRTMTSFSMPTASTKPKSAEEEEQEEGTSKGDDGEATGKGGEAKSGGDEGDGEAKGKGDEKDD